MKAFLLITMSIVLIHRLFVNAEGASSGRGIWSPLALGGMVNGLLNMQIRPEGGFFEERYKEIFPTDIDIPIATASDHDTRYGTPNSVVIRSIVSEDGKALVDAVNGKSPNPCFDTNRLSRNSLLVLACSLQQADSQLENQAK